MTVASPAATRGDATLYRDLDAAGRYIHETRDRGWLALLRRRGIDGLAGNRVLEIGCGDGSLIRTFFHYGAEPQRLEAFDVDAERVARARAEHPGVSIREASVAAMPYEDGAFDLAFAFTVLSSVADDETRRRGAAEATRVLRPGGLLVVYDFWTNPKNRRVHPISADELRALFAPHDVAIERVTLAPPIVTVLRGNAMLCAAVERLPFLRTHHLTAITKA